MTSYWSSGINKPKGIGCLRIFNKDKSYFQDFNINGINIKDIVGDR